LSTEALALSCNYVSGTYNNGKVTERQALKMLFAALLASTPMLPHVT
jgi:hypothetical protein